MFSKSLTFAFLIIFVILSSGLFEVGNSSSPTQPPQITIVYPTNGTTINSNFGDYPTFKFLLIYQTNDSLSWVGYSINGRSNVTVTRKTITVNETINDSGYNNLTLYANDTLGNWATPQTVTYLVVFHHDLPSLSPGTSNQYSDLTNIVLAAIIIMVIIVIIILILIALTKRKKPNLEKTPF